MKELIKSSILFAAGAAVGAAVALYVTSEAGQQAREKLKDLVEEAEKSVKEVLGRTQRFDSYSGLLAVCAMERRAGATV